MTMTEPVAGEQDDPSDALPMIVSVDDHVVEPAHVWQNWLPERVP